MCFVAQIDGGIGILREVARHIHNGIVFHDLADLFFGVLAALHGGIQVFGDLSGFPPAQSLFDERLLDVCLVLCRAEIIELVGQRADIPRRRILCCLFGEPGKRFSVRGKPSVELCTGHLSRQIHQIIGAALVDDALPVRRHRVGIVFIPFDRCGSAEQPAGQKPARTGFPHVFDHIHKRLCARVLFAHAAVHVVLQALSEIRLRAHNQHVGKRVGNLRENLLGRLYAALLQGVDHDLLDRFRVFHFDQMLDGCLFKDHFCRAGQKPADNDLLPGCAFLVQLPRLGGRGAHPHQHAITYGAEKRANTGIGGGHQGLVYVARRHAEKFGVLGDPVEIFRNGRARILCYVLHNTTERIWVYVFSLNKVYCIVNDCRQSTKNRHGNRSCI